MKKLEASDDATLSTVFTADSSTAKSTTSALRLKTKSKRFGKAKKVSFNLVIAPTGHSNQSRRERKPWWLRCLRSLPVISPKSAVHEWMITMKVFLLLFCVWSIPFRLSFPQAAWKLLLVSDILFLFDILRIFSTGFIGEDDKLVLNRYKIAMVYCRTSDIFNRRLGFSFYLDFLSLAAINIIDLLISLKVITAHTVLIRGVAIFFQLDRYISISAHFKVMELSVNSDARRVALMKFLVTLFGAAHWVGCSWWLLAVAYNFDKTTWVYRYFESFLPTAPGTSETDDLLARYGEYF